MKKKVWLLLAFLCWLPALSTQAAVGDSRELIESRYGKPDLLEDQQKKFKTFAQWNDEVAADVVWHGYLPDADKGRKTTLWLSYDRQNRVAKELVLLPEPVAVRDFAAAIAAQYDLANGEIFLEKAAQGLAAVVDQEGAGQLQLGFITQKDGTRPNMHTLIRGFEVTRILPQELRAKLSEGIWQRTDNFFRPQLYFSERLVKRAKTDLIVIHHTAIENMSVADIHQLHLSNGWAGIGYHKVVLPDGSIADGRPAETVGAHALGVNTHSLGIVIVGDFEKRRPDERQLQSLLQVTRQMMVKYDLPAAKVVPHREATQGTSCPGAQFPWAEFCLRLKNMR